MSDPASPPLANSPDARSPTGEILDQSQTQTEPVTSSTIPADPTTHEPKPATPADPVPESYTFKTSPGTEPDEKLVSTFTPIFRELNLTQAQADKLVEAYNSHAGARAEDAKAVIAAMGEKWNAELKADKVMGSQLPTVQADVGKAITQLPADVQAPFRAAMNDTMAGNNPAIVRAFWEFAKLVNEGKHVTGGGPSPVTKPGSPSRPSMAESMYPDLPRAS
jgi:hypothetical protein